MYDILVYLYQNYFRPESCPDPATLTRKLCAVGFEREDVDCALRWLKTLELSPVSEMAALSGATTRFFAPEEIAKLDRESRGFLLFLESAGVLDARLRELIIDSALALDDTPVSLGRFKVIVLMVLWSQGHDINTLILEELLTVEPSGQMH